MSYSHHAWAQRNLDAWLDKYDAANEDEHGLLEHERPVDLAASRAIRIRRAHDRLRGLSTAEILARHPDREAA